MFSRPATVINNTKCFNLFGTNSKQLKFSKARGANESFFLSTTEQNKIFYYDESFFLRIMIYWLRSLKTVRKFSRYGNYTRAELSSVPATMFWNTSSLIIIRNPSDDCFFCRNFWHHNSRKNLSHWILLVARHLMKRQ